MDIYGNMNYQLMRRSICVVGLGYVGLPLAVAFDEAGHDVVGFDIDTSKIERLNRGVDLIDDVGEDRLAESTVEFTDDETAIERCDFVVIALPTPVDDLKNPNLEYIGSGGETVGRNIREGATVVLESTVYPGATREILQPAVERASGLTAGDEFAIGYSPERLVPGDDEHDLSNVVKIVSGETEAVADKLEALYETIVDAGVHRSPSIEAAEAAKCIENIQRDINIALVNELAVACNAIGLDTHHVLEAANTKWNFHDYRPGLVGGHCIPVDPFFMIYESKRNGFTPRLIERAREINDYMPQHVGDETLRLLTDNRKAPSESTVLLLGLAYKPNVEDIRTSAVDGIVRKLAGFNVDVVGYDPRVDAEVCREAFGIPVQDELSFGDIDAVILSTPHDELVAIDYEDAAESMAPRPAVVDVLGKLDAERLRANDRIDYERV